MHVPTLGLTLPKSECYIFEEEYWKKDWTSLSTILCFEMISEYVPSLIILSLLCNNNNNKNFNSIFVFFKCLRLWELYFCFEMSTIFFCLASSAIFERMGIKYLWAVIQCYFSTTASSFLQIWDNRKQTSSRVTFLSIRISKERNFIIIFSREFTNFISHLEWWVCWLLLLSLLSHPL